MAANTHNGRVLEFHYDISCPYAYIASTKVPSLASRTSTKITYRPVLLGAIYRATSAPQGAAGSASDTFNPTKRVIGNQSFQRTLARYRIPLNYPKAHPIKTVSALRLLYRVPEDEIVELSRLFFKAYWVDGVDVSSKEALIGICRGSGLKVARTFDLGVFEDLAKEGKLLEEATKDAIDRGAFGVPSFWLPQEKWVDTHGKEQFGRLYWGQDRMHFVEAALLAAEKGGDWAKVKGLGSLMPRVEWVPKRAGRVKLEFWFDFSSPWAFLGWTQLGRIKRLFGEKLEIELRPFLLGALFREIGAPMLPMTAVSEQKRQYMHYDLHNWVKYWNAINRQNGNPDKEINFHWADQFPIRSPTALRVAILDPKTIPTIYRACWENNDNISKDEVLAEVLNKAGFTGTQLVKDSAKPEVKETLRKFTQTAQDTGLCGVPSYRVFEQKPDGSWKLVSDVIWGQDESPAVEDVIAGWDAESSTNVATVGPEHERAGQTKSLL